LSDSGEIDTLTPFVYNIHWFYILISHTDNRHILKMLYKMHQLIKVRYSICVCMYACIGHWITSIPKLELMVNSNFNSEIGIGFDYLKKVGTGIEKFWIGNWVHIN